MKPTLIFSLAALADFTAAAVVARAAVVPARKERRGKEGIVWLAFMRFSRFMMNTTSQTRGTNEGREQQGAKGCSAKEKGGRQGVHHSGIASFLWHRRVHPIFG